MQTQSSQRIAAGPPALHMRDAALEQACERIVDAGLAGVRRVVLPEGAIPGYPTWVWALRPGEHPLLDALHAEAIANTVCIPSDVTDRLCQIAQRAQVDVAVGVIERDNVQHSAVTFSTMLFINAQGCLVGRYRCPITSTAAQWFWLPTESELPAGHPSAISRVGGI